MGTHTLRWFVNFINLCQKRIVGTNQMTEVLVLKVLHTYKYWSGFVLFCWWTVKAVKNTSVFLCVSQPFCGDRKYQLVQDLSNNIQTIWKLCNLQIKFGLKSTHFFISWWDDCFLHLCTTQLALIHQIVIAWVSQ